jgi:signal transduction histidine kinase
MRFNITITLVLILTSYSANAQMLTERELIDRTLTRVNQYKVNNQNDSALYELLTTAKSLSAGSSQSGYMYVEVGNVYFHLKLYKTAIKFYERANAIFLKHNDLIGQSIVIENYGGIQGRLAHNDSALFYYQKALELQKKAGDKFYAAHSEIAIGLRHSLNGNFEEAKRYAKASLQSIDDNTIVNHPRYRWDVQFIPQQVYLSTSDIFRNAQQYDSAEYYLIEAIRMTKLHGIDPHRVRYITFLATFYLEQKQLPKAYTAINHALSLADSIQYVWGRVGALQVLRNYYNQTKDAKKELEAAFNYLEYKDKMFNERNNDELIVMSNLVLQYENELEIERQQNIVKEKEKINVLQRKQNYLLLGIVIVFAIAFVAIVYLYRSLRQRNKLVKQVSSELQTNNETMRMLLSVISHDLRSPFRSMMGLTKVTMMEQQLTAPELQERVGMMHDTASKGSILLDNLLQWVALQRDKVLIEKTTFSVEDVVNETLQELANLALTEKVTIEKQLYLTTFSSDRNGLKVIVRNLLTNAIKYSANKKVTLAMKAVDENVFIHVTDQGPGIPQEILENLFQQADMKTVAAKGGGLGMVIVKEMVTQLKGDIRAVNLPEGGARFEVRLPLH